MTQHYVLISPCRNEADFMRQTLDTVIAQSVRPARWVIVDDGSTDATPRILTAVHMAGYASRHEWITIVTRTDRGRRAVGFGVIEAFLNGYDTMRTQLARALLGFAVDLRLTAAMRQAARGHIESPYGFSRVRRQLVDIYAAALGQ